MMLDSYLHDTGHPHSFIPGSDCSRFFPLFHVFIIILLLNFSSLYIFRIQVLLPFLGGVSLIFSSSLPLPGLFYKWCFLTFLLFCFSPPAFRLFSFSILWGVSQEYVHTLSVILYCHYSYTFCVIF